MAPLSLHAEEIESLRILGFRVQIMATGYGKHEDTPVAITPECVTLAQLEREVSRLQEELSAIIQQARLKFNPPEEGSK